MRLRVLTWNLMHGRSIPPSGRELLAEFASALAGWDWDVALLQEVPPWWPSRLAQRLDCEQRMVLTSRYELLALRRALAIRWPDLIKSNGGGCNAILARADRIVADRRARLCLLPERRWLHAVRLAQGVWVGNLHATVHNPAAAERESRVAAQTALAWAQAEPLALGGDFNLRELSLDGLEHAASHDVDHVFAARLAAVDSPQVLDRGALSDHAPVAVTLDRAPA
ncbi:MAG: endonuclease/exonuclease/phosphatase family protein [Solirubrobacterales bacterium]|nr:endonuclease/exonuclease/phosphatase family protein [Solirubrobacterales bacterium]